jgi:hypothetical protein
MKKLILYITLSIVILLSICFTSIGCSNTIGDQPNLGNIGNPVAQKIEDNNSPSNTITDGQSITLNNPTFEEMKDFLAKDPTSEKPFVSGIFECRHFATEVDNNAQAAGWQCAFVLICYAQGQHAVVAFDTIDRGIIYIEPQTDDVIDIYVGGTYQNQTIVEILLAW